MTIKQSAFDQLQALKNELDPTGAIVYIEEEKDVIYKEFEQEEIKETLLEQHRLQVEQTEESFDFLDSFGGPVREERFEIEYYDGVIKAVVDISFENFSGTLSDVEYMAVRDLLIKFSKEKVSSNRTALLKEIESYGEDTIEIIFRECRQFDLVSEKAFKEIVQLLGRLTYRSLKGRLLVKAILESSSSYSHLRLAISVAGVLREREAVESLKKHIFEEDLYLLSLEALFRIREIESLPTMIEAINQLSPHRKDLIDESVRLSDQFARFGPKAINMVFDAYANCTNSAIRPVYIKGFRSFGEEGIPTLSGAIQAEIDNNRFMQICMTLGGLKSPSAVAVLIDGLKTEDVFRKKAVIRGLGFSGDSSTVDLLINELEMADDNTLKSECISALSFVGYKNDNMMKAVRKYTNSSDVFLRLRSMACLLRSGEEKHLADMMKALFSDDAGDRHAAETVISRLPIPSLERVAQYLLNVDDEQALQIITVLQRPNRLSRKIGQVLEEKLKHTLPQVLEIEIYRLIAKHASTRTEILPINVLYDARDQGKSDRIQRELTSLIREARTNSGEVVVRD